MNYLERMKLSLMVTQLAYTSVKKTTLKEFTKENKERYILFHFLSKRKERSLSENAVKKIIKIINKNCKYKIKIIHNDLLRLNLTNSENIVSPGFMIEFVNKICRIIYRC